jgi:hypothetical protein
VAALAVGLSAAAGCGGSSSSGSSNSTPAQVLRAGSTAAAKQSTVGFDVKLDVRLHGTIHGVGAAAAFLHGPISVELKGHSTAGGSATKADLAFAVNFTGGAVSGHLLAPGGETAYVQLPSLLGPGWHSFPISSATSAATGGSSSSSSSALLSKIRPAQWLDHLKLSQSGGTDTISADLNVRRMLSSILAMSGSAVTSAQRAQLSQAESAFKTASGSISYDQSTHLPSAFAARLSVVVPPALAKQAQGLHGIDLSLSAHFSDWGKGFTVKAPSGATPLQLSGLGTSLPTGTTSYTP